MIDEKRLKELMEPEQLKALADSLEDIAPKGPYDGGADTLHLERAAAVLRKVAQLKSRTSMVKRDEGRGEELYFSTIFSVSELRARVGSNDDVMRQCVESTRRRLEETLLPLLADIRPQSKTTSQTWQELMADVVKRHGEPTNPAVEFFHFGNGMTAAVDRFGEQVPQVQAASSYDLGEKAYEESRQWRENMEYQYGR